MDLGDPILAVMAGRIFLSLSSIHAAEDQKPGQASQPREGISLVVAVLKMPLLRSALEGAIAALGGAYRGKMSCDALY